MQERRLDLRKRINTAVRLYHPTLGRLDAVSHDISKGGMAIELNSFRKLEPDLTASGLFLRTMNIDILFPVCCLRQQECKLVVKFLE